MSTFLQAGLCNVLDIPSQIIKDGYWWWWMGIGESLNLNRNNNSCISISNTAGQMNPSSWSHIFYNVCITQICHLVQFGASYKTVFFSNNNSNSSIFKEPWITKCVMQCFCHTTIVANFKHLLSPLFPNSNFNFI